jgi:DNA polymerase III epsilon subunit-like protein
MDNDEERSEGTIVVVDLETSGLDPRRHAILQIGAAPVFCAPGSRAGGADPFEIEVRLRGDAEWDEGAERVHGITRAEAEKRDRCPESEAIPALLRWLERCEPGPVLLAGMNPAFDRDFLHAAAERCGLGREMRRWIRHRTLDLHSVAVAYALASRIPVPPGGWATDEIYDLLDQEAEAKPHRAGEGVRREGTAFIRLVHRIRWISGR